MAISRDDTDIVQQHYEPTRSVSLTKIVQNTIDMAKDIADKTGVCSLVNSNTGQVVTQAAGSVPNPYGSAVNVAGKLCAEDVKPPSIVSKYPTGSVAYLDPSLGQFKIAVPPTVGKLFVPQALESTLPSGVVQVNKSQFDRLTKPWYSQTSVKIGGGVLGAAILGTAAFLAIG